MPFKSFGEPLWQIHMCRPFLRNPEGGDIEDIALDTIFSEDDSDVAEDDSESDGYLSEVVKYIILLLLKNVF